LPDKSGKVLSDTDLDAISTEVESANYDVELLKARRRGRPIMGSGPAAVVPVRLDPDLRKAVEARAAEDDSPTSDVVRRALREFLHVA
jgi:CRISPR-associated endonuclease/helicase Cas3